MARLSFDSEVCRVVGANAATIFSNIKHWCEKNEANGTHFYDDKYWTYNSKKAFERLFKCFTERQIRTALDKLLDQGFIISADFNKAGYDKTRWYAVNPNFAHMTFKSTEDDEYEQNIAIPRGNPHMTKKSDGRTNRAASSDQKVQPIPDIKPDIKINNKKKSGRVELSAAVDARVLMKEQLEFEIKLAEMRERTKANPKGYFAKGIAKLDEYLDQRETNQNLKNIYDRAEHLELLHEFKSIAMSIALNFGSHSRTVDVDYFNAEICKKGFSKKMDAVEQSLIVVGMQA